MRDLLTVNLHRIAGIQIIDIHPWRHDGTDPEVIQAQNIGQHDLLRFVKNPGFGTLLNHQPDFLLGYVVTAAFANPQQAENQIGRQAQQFDQGERQQGDDAHGPGHDHGDGFRL